MVKYLVITFGFFFTSLIVQEEEVLYKDHKCLFVKDNNTFSWSFTKENFKVDDVIEFRLFDTIKYFHKKIDKNSFNQASEKSLINEIVIKEVRNKNNDIDIQPKHIRISKILKKGDWHIYYQKAFFTFRQGTFCPLQQGELYFQNREILLEIKQNETIVATKFIKFQPPTLRRSTL
jgi:hypothetical protein